MLKMILVSNYFKIIQFLFSLEKNYGIVVEQRKKQLKLAYSLSI